MRFIRYKYIPWVHETKKYAMAHSTGPIILPLFRDFTQKKQVMTKKNIASESLSYVAADVWDRKPGTMAIKAAAVTLTSCGRDVSCFFAVLIDFPLEGGGFDELSLSASNALSALSIYLASYM